MRVGPCRSRLYEVSKEVEVWSGQVVEWAARCGVPCSAFLLSPHLSRSPSLLLSLADKLFLKPRFHCVSVCISIQSPCSSPCPSIASPFASPFIALLFPLPFHCISVCVLSLRPRSLFRLLMAGEEAMEPFMGIKVRRYSSMYRVFSADYIDVPANPTLVKLLSKQGDKQVLFADTIMKLNRKCKLVRRVLIVTDIAIYILDSTFYRLKHRIPLQASSCAFPFLQ